MHLKPDYELRISDWVHLKNKNNEIAIVGINYGDYQGVNQWGEEYSFVRDEVKELADYAPFRFKDKIVFEQYQGKLVVLYNQYDGWSFYGISTAISSNKSYKTIENARKAALVYMDKADAERKARVQRQREAKFLNQIKYSFEVGDVITGLNGYNGKAWTITAILDFDVWDWAFDLVDDESNTTRVKDTEMQKVSLTDSLLESIRKTQMDLFMDSEDWKKTEQGKANQEKFHFMRNLRKAFNEKNIK